LDREQLGAELRRLRTEAGLTGEQLARLLNVAQSTISRFESGKLLASPEAIRAWAEATHAPPDMLQTLLDAQEQLAALVTSWHVLHRAGLVAKQEDVQRLEAQSHAIHVFQPVCVPGLLQIAEYARLVIASGNPSDQADVAEAVAKRLQRGTVLYDEDKRFEFILTEPALRWRPGSAQVQRAQLAHLASIASLPHVTLGVIPLAQPSNTPYVHQFVLYEGEEAVVTVETWTAELLIRGSQDIATYRDYLERLRRLAITGDQAVERIRATAGELSG
jgi:transcriptional regulator with XRE-family HTH domain